MSTNASQDAEAIVVMLVEISSLSQYRVNEIRITALISKARFKEYAILAWQLEVSVFCCINCLGDDAFRCIQNRCASLIIHCFCPDKAMHFVTVLMIFTRKINASKMRIV